MVAIFYDMWVELDGIDYGRHSSMSIRPSGLLVVTFTTLLPRTWTSFGLVSLVVQRVTLHELKHTNRMLPVLLIRVYGLLVVMVPPYPVLGLVTWNGISYQRLVWTILKPECPNSQMRSSM